MTKERATSVRSRIGRHLRRWQGRAGFSLTETTIILAAMTVLTATAAPSIMDYVAQARTIKASGDVNVLGVSLARMLFDVTRVKAGPSGQPPMLLVGPGEAPMAGDPTTNEWATPLDGVRAQSLVDHLVTNEAGYPRRQGGGFAKGWGGPYVESVPLDPWGHRYGANVGVFASDISTPMIVLSAGPNGKVETPFQLLVFKPGGDDIMALLGSQR